MISRLSVSVSNIGILILITNVGLMKSGGSGGSGRSDGSDGSGGSGESDGSQDLGGLMGHEYLMGLAVWMLSWLWEVLLVWMIWMSGGSYGSDGSGGSGDL